MKKIFRIKKNKDFQFVFKQGKSYANRQFIIYLMKKPEQSNFRIGLSVSKKVGNSVTRNRIKRYIRQSFFELLNQVQGKNDYVIIARKPTAEMDFHEVKKSLIHVLRLSKVLTRSPEEKREEKI